MMSKFNKPNKIEKTQETLEQVGAYQIWAIDGTNDTKDWGISRETCEYFGVRTGYDQMRQRIMGYYFPVYKGDRVTGYIRVDPERPKDKGRFTAVGDVSVDCKLIGQVQAEKNQGRKLIIVEGMKDLLTAHQAIHSGETKKGYHDVVTFPMGIGSVKGTTNARQALSHNISFIQNYGAPVTNDKGTLLSGITTCFDNDNPSNDDSITNVGQEAVKDCALVLKDFYNVVLPMNDCYDYREEHGEDKLFKQLAFSGKRYELGTISETITDEEFEELLKPREKGVYVDVLPKTMNFLHGLRSGEMTILLAPPKSGKTSICKQLNYALIMAGRKVFSVYLEEDAYTTRQSFMAIHCGMHIPVFIDNPRAANPEKLMEAKKILKSGRAMIYDSKKGKMTPQNVINQLTWAWHRGAEFGIIDHTSYIASQDNGGNERKMLDNLMTDLADFVKKTGMHLLVVAHITIDKNRPKPKNQDGSIKYPYWYEVEEHDGRGSSIYAHVCWNMIAIDKQVTEDSSRGLTRTKVLYNRVWDVTGVCDTLSLDQTTGRLVALE